MAARRVGLDLKSRTIGLIESLLYPEPWERWLRFEAGRPVRYDLGDDFVVVTGEHST